MTLPLRFGTYTEIQCPPGRDHAELIYDVIRLGEHADERRFDIFTALEHPFFEQFAINPNPLALFLYAGPADPPCPLSDPVPYPAAA